MLVTIRPSKGYLSKILPSRWIIFLVLLTCLINPATAFDTEVNAITKLNEEPAGVIIEIAESEEDALRELIPEVHEIVERIHQRFPDLHIAVVSHGFEQFALTKNEAEKNLEIHNGVRQLVDKNISMYVCGTHASWYGIEPEDFPDYVDVAPAGPAQINDYRNLGYIHIKL